ncbi:alpha/beta hydrolase [Thermomonospora umbrina]|uniref:Acetyl esterase/lipase n=1 Tax=Thermomonospora umbrina TaxID=111806 RepID=A0A3D9T7Q5_9ACTN|nr:alpha/beta hydrolase [Thermomonospora umbrina]REF00705.1 acetyl esterase/lipase [Thermomonospora umbrina]
MTPLTCPERKNAVETDLVYARPESAELRLDLHVPEGADAAPVAVYLHGGGWLTGSRKDAPERLRALTEHGIAVAAIDYRTSDTAKLPAQLDDLAAAVDWLRRHGAAHGLATERIGVLGASAGAHLAALAALTSGGVQAMVGYFGYYDLTSRAAQAPPDPSLAPPAAVLDTVWPDWVPMPPTLTYLQALLIGVPEDEASDEDLRPASPVAHAAPGAPPMLLLHGTADAVVSPQQSRWLAEAVTDAGGTAELVLIDGANHEDPAFARSDVAATVARFLRAHL